MNSERGFVAVDIDIIIQMLVEGGREVKRSGIPGLN